MPGNATPDKVNKSGKTARMQLQHSSSPIIIAFTEGSSVNLKKSEQSLCGKGIFS